MKFIRSNNPIRSTVYLRSFPIVLFLVCLASFGLLIPWLGYYFDDWPVLLITRLQGSEGFIRFYEYDRPISAWTYLLTTPFLGTERISWHIFTLLLRWLTALSMWSCLRGLWPDLPQHTAWMTLLFAVYPAFDQQPIAVTYSQHWITFFIYLISLSAMIYSVRRPRWYWPLTAFGVAGAAVHVLTMEYFLGLELLRPLVLWIVLGSEHGRKRRLCLTLVRWIPYLMILIAFVIWRLFFLRLAGEDPNRPDLLYLLLAQPIAALSSLVQFALQDLVNILLGAWYRGLEPTKLILTNRLVLFALFMSTAVAILSSFYAYRLRELGRLVPAKEATGTGETNFPKPLRNPIPLILVFGLFAFLLGPLPVWLTGRSSLHGIYGGRFTLAATFGASILWVGLLEIFSDRLRSKAILLGIMIGLATGFHLQRANEFRWAWEDQTRFYWQLYWRAPYLEPQTAILADGEIFPYVGRYSTSAALNLLYPSPGEASGPPEVSVIRPLPYWFAELYPEFMKHPEESTLGKELTGSFRSFTFTGSTQKALAIFYEPEGGRCLWVLSPEDVDNPEISSLLRDALPISNLSRIQPDSPLPGNPPASIFGREPEHGWCYYFQKAELALQFDDWEMAARLGDEAQERGYTPNNPQEWLPFIEAYAHTGRLDEAIQWSRHIYRINPDLAPQICYLWKQKIDTANLPDKDQIPVKQILRPCDKS